MNEKQRGAAERLADAPLIERDHRWHKEAAALLRELAAEPDHMDELRKACAELLGNDPETWPSHGNAPLAIAASMAILCKAVEPVQDMQKALRDAQHTADFYQRRCEALQQWQSRMRDPERTVVCDILANGFTLDPPVPHDRYALAQEPDEYRCGGPDCDGNCCQPVQEPVIWIQSNHLQHAKNGPYLSRTGPTKLMSDFIPLYAHPPQQRKTLTQKQIDDLLNASREVDEGPTALVRRVERAHGIGEAQ